jgi:hypothetical protein
MGLVAAGVNGIKLGVGDEVVGMEILPAEGDVFVLASDGKAKRIAQSDFPSQGRYGRGVILWDLPLGVKLAGLAIGKGTQMITLHLLKAAAKMTRLDEAGLKKRAATRGDSVVEVKPGDAVLGLTAGWSMDRYVTIQAPVTEPKSKKQPKSEQLELIKSPPIKNPSKAPAAKSSTAAKPPAKQPTDPKTGAPKTVKK